MESLSTDFGRESNPLDLLEEMASANDWPFDRFSDSEMGLDVAGQWCDYHVCVVWHHELAAMMFSCHFEHRVPQGQRERAGQLLAAANERLWLGHFELTPEEGAPLFRHTLPLRGLFGASVEQLEDLLDTALTECERVYPALQLVVWAGQPVAMAIEHAMFEPMGEA
jgi:hypothetical protein